MGSMVCDVLKLSKIKGSAAVFSEKTLDKVSGHTLYFPIPRVMLTDIFGCQICFGQVSCIHFSLSF